MQCFIAGESNNPHRTLLYCTFRTMSFAPEFNFDFLNSGQPVVGGDAWSNQLAAFDPYDASHFQLGASNQQCVLPPNYGPSVPARPTQSFQHTVSQQYQSTLPYRVQETGPRSAALGSASAPIRSFNHIRYHPYTYINPQNGSLPNARAPLARGFQPTVNVPSMSNIYQTPRRYHQWERQLGTDFSFPTLPMNLPNAARAPIAQSYRSAAAAPHPLIKQESFDIRLSTSAPSNAVLSVVQGRISQNVEQAPAAATGESIDQCSPQESEKSPPQLLDQMPAAEEPLTSDLSSSLNNVNGLAVQAAEKPVCKKNCKIRMSRKTRDPEKPIVCRLPKASEGAVAGEICNTLCENATALLTHFKDRKMHKLLNNKNDKIPMVCGWYGPDDKTQCKDVLSNSGGVCRHILESSTHLGLRRKKPARKYCPVCMA